MTCYQRHLMPLFDALELPYDQPNRRKVDTALREMFGLDDSAHCPEVWACIKALPAEEFAALPARVAEHLGRSG